MPPYSRSPVQSESVIGDRCQYVVIINWVVPAPQKRKNKGEQKRVKRIDKKISSMCLGYIGSTVRNCVNCPTLCQCLMRSRTRFSPLSSKPNSGYLYSVVTPARVFSIGLCREHVSHSPVVCSISSSSCPSPTRGLSEGCFRFLTSSYAYRVITA